MSNRPVEVDAAWFRASFGRLLDDAIARGVDAETMYAWLLTIAALGWDRSALGKASWRAKCDRAWAATERLSRSAKEG